MFCIFHILNKNFTLCFELRLTLAMKPKDNELEAHVLWPLSPSCHSRNQSTLNETPRLTSASREPQTVLVLMKQSENG